MPIYEYACENCGHSFEKLIFRRTDDIVKCPKCGSDKVRKLISPVKTASTSGTSTCSTGSRKGFS
ncbi:MAG: zinc ribbon domain-containing protein [Desulfobacterales bacterium]|nr:zinc ribbon domain-containing protein [Desulfobacterales bacterium]MDD4070891.1 zinc ribbon domain-containing protein [Desulfobacterales bacterium]MDD4392898.1 zinc ribbon domain-containing protein [Desulfobacterales bacterium]